MDESLSKAYWGSLQSRTGGFFWLPGGATIRPLPASYFAGVTVLAPSAIRPTKGSKETLGFLGARSPFDGILLLIDGLLKLVLMGFVSAPLFLAACSLIAALFYASSIFKKRRRVKLGINVNYLNKKRTTDLRCWVHSSYLIVAWVGLGPSQYQWTVLRLTSLAQFRSFGLDFAKILSRKLNSLRSICGRRWTEKRRQTSKTLKSIKQNESLYMLHDGCISDGSNIPQVLSTGIWSISLGWHIQPSLSRKK